VSCGIRSVGLLVSATKILVKYIIIYQNRHLNMKYWVKEILDTKGKDGEDNCTYSMMYSATE